MGAAAPRAQGIMQAAKGGRIGYDSGGFGSYKDFIESTGDDELMDLYVEGLSSGDFTRLFDALKKKGYPAEHAKGGRIGYQEGIGPNQGSPAIMAEAITDSEVEDAYGVSVEDAALLSEIRQIAEQSVSPPDFPATDSDYEALEVLSNKHNVDLEVVIQMAKTTNFPTPEQSKGEMYAQYMALGGRPGYAYGTSKDGIMNLGGLEKDYRTTGGFVPIGAYEKKDDVPARLSKNEFVFTADAVRAAGGGSINKGAQRMYDTMKHLEARPTAKRMTA
jgi:hypothetical protein